MHQQRDLDRSIHEIERNEVKIKLAVKKAAKDKQMECAKSLAKELVMSGKAKERLVHGKAQLENIGIQLKVAAANLKLTGSVQKSTEVVKSMNALMKGSQTAAVARELAQEFSRFGIIEEMMSEQLDQAIDVDGDLDELADSQVDALVQEILSGVKLQGAGAKQVPVAQAAEDAAAALERRMKELGN
jgi:charged multivesicular body protein 3